MAIVLPRQTVLREWLFDDAVCAQRKRDCFSSQVLLSCTLPLFSVTLTLSFLIKKKAFQMLKKYLPVNFVPLGHADETCVAVGIYTIKIFLLLFSPSELTCTTYHFL